MSIINTKEEASKNFRIGKQLYQEKKYNNAERLLRQAAEGLENTLGKEYIDTISSKNWLGCALYQQKKYTAAEELLQQVAKEREKTLGKEHEDTLDTKQWLGRTLHEQEKYSEAEAMLQQAAEGREKIFGREHTYTLNAKNWLGCTLYRQKKYSEAESMFRQAVDGRAMTLGKEHTDTLSSKDWLGTILYQQQKYNEAEGLLRQAAEGREKTLGKEHKDTLDSKNWLGRTLHEQEKYSEAEGMLQQAAEGREKIFGREHTYTLNAKNWLGCTLYRQKKYSEAESMFRQAVDGRAMTLGKEHTDTLSSKDWLGTILYQQQKYNEAEGLLRQAAEGREKTLGKEHKDTLDSKNWLGRTLHEQEKYSEAEGMLQQVAEGREKLLGREHAYTLNSKNWLGCTLYEQQKYSEAEGPLRQAVDGREKVLGREHNDTLEARFWLGLALYYQEKYGESEKLLRQASEGRKKAYGKYHKNTLDSLYWLGAALYQQERFDEAEALLQQVALSRKKTSDYSHVIAPQNMSLVQNSTLGTTPPAQPGFQLGLVDQLHGFFLDRDASSDAYTDLEINQVSTLLRSIYPQWSQSPRTYIILRIIKQLGVFNDLLHIGFSDYWLPATERSLPEVLSQSDRAAFVNMQHLVLTKSSWVEKGEHCHFAKGEPLPFVPKDILGNGGFGQVDKVASTISFREYARKRVLRSAVFRGPRKEHTRQFIAEIQILKRLQHRHIIELIGSYTDSKYIGLIMLPIAEMDLGKYLSLATIANHSELRTFFGCLASALKFLHEKKIRHKDIKPGNILIDRGNVLFADFGLSLDFEDASGSTTTSMVNGRTPRYCAPEVARLEPRNTKSDIWSLGVVFMEMIVVLKGKSVQDMDKFFTEHGSRQSFIRTNMDALSEFIVELSLVEKLSDNRAFGWTQQMLSLEQHSRPEASLVTLMITDSQQEEEMGFCGTCCNPLEECFSDRGD